MKCPNCQKTMEKTSDFELQSEIDDGFWLKHYYMKMFIYTCKDCNIKYEKGEYGDYDGKWYIPEQLKPTQKQINFANKIGVMLNLNTDKLLTKHQYWEFIKNNKDKFQQTYEDIRDGDHGYLGEGDECYYDYF